MCGTFVNTYAFTLDSNIYSIQGKCLLFQNVFSNFYRPPMNLGKGNVFNRVCRGGGGPCVTTYEPVQIETPPHTNMVIWDLPSALLHLSDLFKCVHHVTHTSVGKWAVGLPLKARL